MLYHRKTFYIRLKFQQGGVVDEVTIAGRVIALIDIFGRMTPIEFEPKQLTPAAQTDLISASRPQAATDLIPQRASPQWSLTTIREWWRVDHPHIRS
jgi:hypothetical protein